jgi:pyruvate,orthophosphate dikinase
VTYVYDCGSPPGMPVAELKALIGGKAASLGVMAAELGLPVPPAFVVTTAGCNEYLANGWPDALDAELRAHMRRMEEKLGRRFGDPHDPLLVSVRSGAPVSMPGMMDTVLNLGLNATTAQGLARVSENAEFAQDCLRRFTGTFKKVAGTDEVPEDPWAQLRLGVAAVFRSWNSDRARTYRKREGIRDDLGTAAIIQTMVFGNRGPDSASGVLFTRNPATGEPTMYGDVMFNAQGEDVVAGTHRTEELAALGMRLPAVGKALAECASVLERHYADLCDIEFTVEDGQLWLLQVRVGKRSAEAALRIARDMAEDPDFPVSKEEAVRRVRRHLGKPPTRAERHAEDFPVLTKGLPASPGSGAGEIATSPDRAVTAAEADRPVILVRAQTSPDDVHGMARAAGILTSAGGLASHAAVVARGWGVPAVVGAAEVEVTDGRVTIAGEVFTDGDPITIDGATGEVFAGIVPRIHAVVPEARTLLRWAEELGVEVPRENTEPLGESVAAPSDDDSRTATRDDVLRALAVKGFATSELLAAAILSTTERLAVLVDDLQREFLVEARSGSLRLTTVGQQTATRLVTEDRNAWGVDNAQAALDAFLALDGRMKQTVTAWQLKADSTINDHMDTRYDETVLARLSGLHRDAITWLTPIVRRIPRLVMYGGRLAHAMALIEGGDRRFVASPRVDSYHSIWFELHEELIILAGRNRADEVAAGRA